MSSSIETQYDPTQMQMDNPDIRKLMGATSPNPAIKPVATIPASVLSDAAKIIYGDREETYGHPGKNCDTIAQFWTTYLKAANFNERGLTAQDVCVMMVLLKQARLANSPNHRDSLVDSAGYVALNERIQEYNSITNNPKI